MAGMAKRVAGRGVALCIDFGLGSDDDIPISICFRIICLLFIHFRALTFLFSPPLLSFLSHVFLKSFMSRYIYLRNLHMPNDRDIEYPAIYVLVPKNT